MSSRTTDPVIRIAIAALLVLACGMAAEHAAAQCDPQLTHLLEPPDGFVNDYFGRSVDVNGPVAIAGAILDDDNGVQSGSAYLFNTTTGSLVAKLLPDDGIAYEIFGFSVAISNGRALVGKPYGKESGVSRGSVYVFDTSSGAQLAKLVSVDGAEGDKFGFSVDAEGSIAVIGAWGDDDNGEDSGSAYLFDITTGTQITKLLPADDGEPEDQFGYSVAISGNTAIIGSSRDDDNGEDSGAAYLFNVTTGDQIAKLLPDDGAAGDRFGADVDINVNTAIISAPGHQDTGFARGSAYLFDTATGNQLHKLQITLAPTGATSFGRSVAINGPSALVGGSRSAQDSRFGYVHLFDTVSGNQFARFSNYDGVDDFGCSVASDGQTMMVGAYNYQSYGYYEEGGRAYLYGPCPTVAAEFTCQPDMGIVPFITQMTTKLHSCVPGQTRRIAGSIHASLASGAFFSNWRAGYTNLASASSFVTSWNQNLPAIGILVGDNTFGLVAEDVTPAPYNQPPYPPAGDTATAFCTVTGVAP